MKCDQVEGGKRVKSHRYLVVLTMKKKMEGEIKFIMSHRLEKSIIRMIRFQMENKSVQCIFNKCPPKSSKNKKFNFFGSFFCSKKNTILVKLDFLRIDPYLN